MPPAAFRVLAETLIQRIRDERYKVGEALPSQAELAEAEPVTAWQARAALDELVAQGWATKAHGVGYQVAAVPPEPPGDPRTWQAWRADVERRLADLEQDRE